MRITTLRRPGWIYVDDRGLVAVHHVEVELKLDPGLAAIGGVERSGAFELPAGRVGRGLRWDRWPSVVT